MLLLVVLSVVVDIWSAVKVDDETSLLLLLSVVQKVDGDECVTQEEEEEEDGRTKAFDVCRAADAAATIMAREDRVILVMDCC